MDNLPTLPATELEPKKELTVSQLQSEVKNLRLWNAELYLLVKNFKTNGEIPDAASLRMDGIQNSLARLENLFSLGIIQRLEKVEERLGK
jgi:hypothetical protein